MKIIKWSTAIVVVLGFASWMGCEGLTGKSSMKSDPVARGKYLVAITGCSDCHTPMKMGPQGPEPDMTKYLSGHPTGLKMPKAPTLAMPWGWAGAITNTAFSGPWGVDYSANLTTDQGTGVLATWTEEMFVRAMRTGKHFGEPNGRPIMPPMPWPDFAQMTDEDLKAVYAYLKTVPAVVNEVPAYEPPIAKK